MQFDRRTRDVFGTPKPRRTIYHRSNICLVSPTIGGVEARPSSLLRDCPEDQIGISIPSPLNARLDALVARANRSGENTSRKELFAALILDASDEAAPLVEAVRAYRTALAEQAIPAGADPSEFLSERDTRPGPRPRRGS